MRALVPALTSLPKLKLLYCQDNALGLDGFVALSNAVCEMPEIEELWLMNNMGGAAGLQELCDCLWRGAEVVAGSTTVPGQPDGTCSANTPIMDSSYM